MKKLISLLLLAIITLLTTLTFTGCTKKIELDKDNYSNYLVFMLSIVDLESCEDTALLRGVFQVESFSKGDYKFKDVKIEFSVISNMIPYLALGNSETDCSVTLNYEGYSIYSYAEQLANPTTNVRIATSNKFKVSVFEISGYVLV